MNLKALMTAIERMTNDLHSKGDDEDVMPSPKKPMAVEIAMTSAKPGMGDMHGLSDDFGDDDTASIDAHHPMTAGDARPDGRDEMGADPVEVVDLLKANFPDVYDEIISMLGGDVE